MRWNNSDRLVAWGTLLFGAIFVCQVSWTYRKHQQYIRDVSRGREGSILADRVFNRLQASARAGHCDEGFWKKARWGGQSGAESSGVVQPVSVEMKPAVCVALADSTWEYPDSVRLSDNEKAYVWRLREPLGTSARL